MTSFKKAARQLLSAARRHRFHQSHALEAGRVLRNIERKHGKTDAAQLCLAEAYARDVLGGSCYAPWLRVYTAVSRRFKEGWIPQNYYSWVVIPCMNGVYGRLSRSRSISRLLFNDEAFPDVGYYANGIFFRADRVAVRNHEVLDFVFGSSEHVAYKLDQNSQGERVFVLRREDFEIATIVRLGNGVFQRFIGQHEIFAQFGSQAVATLRFTTVVDDAGKISLRACFLCLGRSLDTVVRAGTEICVGVELATGKLMPKGYLSDWTDLDAHPDSGVKFEGVSVPAFSACVDKVLALHAKLPFARCIRWEVTVDAQAQVTPLGWDAEDNDVKLSEATQGPCFSDLHWQCLWHSASAPRATPRRYPPHVA